MKKLFVSLLSIFLTLSVFTVFTACNQNGAGGVVNYKTKTLTVGYTDYEPMNYTENGVLKGFDTELALMTFNALGYEVRFKLIEWSNKYNELSSGTIDCLWNGFTANASDDGTPRSEILNLSYYYMQNKQCVIKKKATESLSSIDGLKGKTVAFESGSAADDLLSDVSGANLKAVTSQMDAVKEVNSGTAQYAVIDLLLASRIAGKGNFSEIIMNDGIETEAEFYAIGFAKNQAGEKLRDNVNVMLTAFSKCGVMKTLAEKYGLEKAYIDLSNPA